MIFVGGTENLWGGHMPTAPRSYAPAPKSYFVLINKVIDPHGAVNNYFQECLTDRFHELFKK